MLKRFKRFVKPFMAAVGGLAMSALCVLGTLKPVSARADYRPPVEADGFGGVIEFLPASAGYTIARAAIDWDMTDPAYAFPNLIVQQVTKADIGDGLYTPDGISWILLPRSIEVHYDVSVGWVLDDYEFFLVSDLHTSDVSPSWGDYDFELTYDAGLRIAQWYGSYVSQTLATDCSAPFFNWCMQYPAASSSTSFFYFIGDVFFYNRLTDEFSVFDEFFGNAFYSYFNPSSGMSSVLGLLSTSFDSMLSLAGISNVSSEAYFNLWIARNRNLISSIFNIGYNSGEHSGNAYNNGYSVGYDKGFEDGKTTGYEQGKWDGQLLASRDSSYGFLPTLFRAILQVPFYSVDGLGDLAIVDGTIPVISIIALLLLLSLVIYIVKRFFFS